MDGLTLKIIEGSRAALSLAKTCISTPALINNKIDLSQGPVAVIPLECETSQKSAQAEVSESLVISSEAKKYVSDNIAPGSKSWTLSGYIAGNKATDQTVYFQPTIKINVDVLWQWFERGAVLIFKDDSSQIYDNVVIKSLQTSLQKEAGNAIAFQMTLKEINVMETGLSGLIGGISGTLNRVKKSIAQVGSALGPMASLGTVVSSLRLF